MNQTVQYLQSASDNEETEIPKLVNYLILDAVTANASDIHIEPWESTIAVRIRLNGVLNELVHLPLEWMERISQRFKIMANLVSYQVGLPQEGHVPADPFYGGAELRISIFPTVGGDKIVVRIFDPRSRSFDITQLGLEEEIRDKFINLLTRPSGLILLTGPTGSGKTTVIYSALSHIIQRAGPAISISTVEDPVECRLPMVSQAQINPARDFTYPIALRSLMRQDPQVIMVGEIRDLDTANIALQAGLTGHLVISTIHSGSSAGVFARLVNMELEPFLLASSVIGVMGLRLVRMNCPSCTQEYQPEHSLLRYVPQEAIDRYTFRRGVGCPECLHTGYSGRRALAELLLVDDPFREAILQKLPTRALQQVAIQQGMQTFWQTGLRRAIMGETSLEEIFRVVALDQV